MNKDTYDRAREMAKPLTPKSHLSSTAAGTLHLAVPDRGCPGPKCVRKVNHAGSCWPEEERK